MNNKIFLVDGDGVVLKGRHKYFSQRLSEEKGIDIEKIMTFFKTEFNACQVGKKDLKIVLPKYLSAWGWTGSLEEFLDYWFSGEVEIEERLTEKIIELRKNGIRVYLATDQEKYRAGYLWDTVGLKKYFDGHFFSVDLGVKKSDVKYFQEIKSLLSIDKTTEIYFWDDDLKNVEVAKNADVVGYLFTTYEAWEKEVEDILEKSKSS